MRVVVDYNLCDGNGLCATVAPELFEVDEDDQLHVLDERPGAELWALADQAAQACPKTAISIEEQR
ncbi:ferredoxin [Micromonospora sp. DT229]|uniref:ferredoxin n=1 Tax=Micromonospora sp. DT229 TaxID=3393430 RepID=UPI003CEE6603